MVGLIWSYGCIVTSAATNISHVNLRPAIWRARSGWEVIWHAMASVVSSSLVPCDRVRRAGPLWMVASAGTGGMCFVRLFVRVAIGAGAEIAVCGVCCGQGMSAFRARCGLVISTLRSWYILETSTRGALYGLGTSTLRGWYGLGMSTPGDGVTGSGRYFLLTCAWEKWSWMRL